MTPPGVPRIVSAPPDARPAILDGHWLHGTKPTTISASAPASILEGDALAFGDLSNWLARNAAQFPQGGAIGYLAYELGRAFEAVPLFSVPGAPLFSLAYYDKIEQLTALAPETEHRQPAMRAEIIRDFDHAQFVADVDRIRQYIAAGDIYQANLTQHFSARAEGLQPEDIYFRLSGHQAPMRAFLKTPHVSIISDSPERFFRVKNNRILASPIKGTVARSGDPAEDEAHRRQLLASAKDRAENVMIVDLLRNDLGRVCLYDSIGAQLWEIDALPQLFHLVSHVEGELNPGTTPGEIIRALFPCGSITGAPKIRAMEILSEIEDEPRGISMGAIGIMRGMPGTPEFEMDFSVAIRTITLRNGVADFNVGCGIVYDSKPEAEYEEMLLKAHPLLNALGVGPSAAAMSPSPQVNTSSNRR
jgi:para-aminobenzoate synthetase component I